MVWYKDLHNFELSNEDWEGILIVADWLHAFYEVTMQMSCISKLMLLTTHAVFHGLQEELWKAIAALPKNINPQIKLGLLNAHWKLSDYYHSFNQLPFYTWAASKWLFFWLVLDYVPWHWQCKVHWKSSQTCQNLLGQGSCGDCCWDLQCSICLRGT